MKGYPGVKAYLFSRFVKLSSCLSPYPIGRDERAVNYECVPQLLRYVCNNVCFRCEKKYEELNEKKDWGVKNGNI